MNRKKDPYEILGIGKDATQSAGEIAYTKLARQFHPDRNIGDSGAEARFKEVSDAWNALKKILPQDLVPLPPLPDIHDPDFDQKMENAIGQWLLDNDSPSAANTIEPPPQASQGFDRRTWSTVGTATGNNPTPGLMLRMNHASSSQPRGDWRTARIKKKSVSFSLENIGAVDAENLIHHFPNCFAALKILQQNRPGLCLYDAIVSRAASSRALCIIGAAQVERPACEAALMRPMDSIEIAQENAAQLAPFVIFQGQAVMANKLALDLMGLKMYLEDELIPKLTGAPPNRPGVE